MISRARFFSMPEDGLQCLLPESEALEELVLALCKGAVCQNPKQWKNAIPPVPFKRMSKLPLQVSNALYSAMTGSEGLKPQQVAQNFVNIMFGKAQAKLRLAFDILRNAGPNPDSDFLSIRDSRALLLHIALSARADQNSNSDNSPHLYTNVVKQIEEAISALFSFSNNGKVDFQAFFQFSSAEAGDIALMVLGFVMKTMELQHKLATYMEGSEGLKGYTMKEEKWAQNIAKIQHFRKLPILSRMTHPFLRSKLKGNSNTLLKKLYKKPNRSTTQNFTQQQKLNGSDLAGHVYRFLKKDMIRPFWFELHGSELYIFLTQSSSSPKKILSLGSGFSLIDKDKLDISPKGGKKSDQPLYSFELVFPSGLKKEFLFFDCFEKRAWFTALSSLVGSFDFESEYELLNEVQEIPGEISYKGFSLTTGESLVLSVLPKRPDSSLSKEKYERYERHLLCRVEVLRVCKHPLIPRVIAIHETSDHIYIAQEPSEGGDLASYFQREGLTQKVVGHVLSQMGEVLSFLSKMHIVVGNLRLSSFFLAEPISPSDSTTLPQIRLVDLSEATIVGATSLLVPAPSQSLYSAPEVIERQEGTPIREAADAFSFGVILYEILFQKLPFSKSQILTDIPASSLTSKFFAKNASGLIGSNIVSQLELLEQDPHKRGTVDKFLTQIKLIA